ncbi:hypothetical protein EX30DRAFT_310197 [Ascodesmis nigricans]|uniref:Putative zinc-finger domain-containing protein n=1 Tax=Ascodesmis nigricans TaxID=341454 RepID=A0A4S2MR98_9PEZI|nr:hypothetical protein EX30DRAFT_310197 [Ascodesmis nigricans]
MQGLKYSTKIDPYKELCRFELNGGICNDTSCKSQHFRNIAVGDDELLVDLADIENVPEYHRDTYRDGLYEVIQDMRKNGIRDFTTVARGILKFRRMWEEKQNDKDATMTDV